MAKKKEEPKGDLPIKENILKNETFRFGLGALSLFISFMLLISFISFLVNGGTDQSLIDTTPIKESVSRRNEVENGGGWVGALLAEIIINRGFGVSSIALIFFFFKMAIPLMQNRPTRFWYFLFWSATGMVWGSLLLGFAFSWSTNNSFLFLGGAHGAFVSRICSEYIGTIGTLALIILSGILGFIILKKSAVYRLRSAFDVKKRKAQAAAMVEKLKPENPDVIDEDPEESEKKEEFRNIPFVEDRILQIEGLETESEEKSFFEDFRRKESPIEEEIEIPIVEEKEEIIEPLIEDEVVVAPKVEEKQEVELKVENTNYEENELARVANLPDIDPTMDLSHYKFPTFDLLKQYDQSGIAQSKEEYNTNKNRIIEVLENFQIKISNIKATPGPTVTLYEIVPEPGVRISKIRNLEDDIALSLSALGIRIIAPIPGKGTIGIEVPNKEPQVVSMHSIIASKKFQESNMELPMALGKTITNEIFMIDMAKMPHLLVAGATGQGKSVGLNAIITSLLYKKHPAQLKFVLIDPKKVEFSIYSTIERHFLAKLPNEEEAIITDVTKVVQTLNSLTREMDERYDLLKKAHVRNIKEYNDRYVKRRLNPEKGHRYMPYIVVIIDEFGDLIMTAGKEIELPIARIAQLARAVGIHMIIATQRPSTNIITGTIKANFPARVAFRVSSMIDSRTILDCPGANQLIGRGDMLFSQGSDLVRVQCAFVDTPEVESVTDHISKQQGYPRAFELPETILEGSDAAMVVDSADRDPMFEEVAKIVVQFQQGSTSFIQRRMSLGYNRAGRITDQLEKIGIVGPAVGSKPREVLVSDLEQLDRILNR